MEDWIEALSLILKIFTAYTAVISIFFLLPFRQLRPLYNGIVMDSSVFS